jgi:hypothetical protein
MDADIFGKDNEFSSKVKRACSGRQISFSLKVQ